MMTKNFQNIMMMLMFGAIVYGITAMMDTVRSVDRMVVFIEHSEEKYEANEARLMAIEKRNEEDAEFNTLFLKMSGKIDTLENSINLLMQRLPAPKEESAN